MALDATIPTQANLGWDLARIHRETRAAVNVNALATAKGNMPGMTVVNMIALQTTFDVGGTFVNNITPAPGLTLSGLTGGYSGQLVILRIDEAAGTPNLIIAHNAAIRLQDEVPWDMNLGDTLWLINNDGVPPPGVVVGIWYEVNRSLYKAVLGLITPTTGTRVKVTVDEFLALTTGLL